MLEQITPLILTYNEAPNIARVLEKLRWARRIVVLDSGSDDTTAEIARGFANVELYQRRFDTHARQWNFGLQECGIDSEWVLALDADYVLTDSLVAELRSLQPGTEVSGFRARFRYLVSGRPLWLEGSAETLPRVPRWSRMLFWMTLPVLPLSRLMAIA